MRATTRVSTMLLAGALVAAAGCGPAQEPKGARRLVVASFGGAWQAAQRKAMFVPFARATGVEVDEAEYDGDYALVRDRGGAGGWDVVDVEPAELLRGAEDGIYEPIDYTGVDTDALLTGVRHRFGVALMTYSVVLGYDAGRFPDPGAAPATWADFWDRERFPGKRALRGTPEWTLEIALMADGVPPDRLYPLDLDRAFRSLDRIRSSVVVFDDWADPVNLLATGQVALAMGTNGRLEAARDGGKPVAMSWRGGLVSSDYFVILKGSRHKDLAQELVRYAVGRDAQSAFPRYIDYGPVNRLALDALPEDVRVRLPTHPDHLAESVPFDAEWWFQHEDEAHRRYEEWLRRIR